MLASLRIIQGTHALPLPQPQPPTRIPLASIFCFAYPTPSHSIPPERKSGIFHHQIKDVSCCRPIQSPVALSIREGNCRSMRCCSNLSIPFLPVHSIQPKERSGGKIIALHPILLFLCNKPATQLSFPTIAVPHPYVFARVLFHPNSQKKKCAVQEWYSLALCVEFREEDLLPTAI